MRACPCLCHLIVVANCFCPIGVYSVLFVLYTQLIVAGVVYLFVVFVGMRHSWAQTEIICDA